MVPKPPKPYRDMEMHNNLLLIRTMQEMGKDVWYSQRYGPVNEADYTLWNAISRKTRLKVVFVQAQWIYLRDQYVRDRNNELGNSSISQTEFLSKYKEHMNFLESDIDCWSKLLYDHENDKNDMDFERKNFMPETSAECETIIGGHTEVNQIKGNESPLPTINDETSVSGTKRPAASQCDEAISTESVPAKQMKMTKTEKRRKRKEKKERKAKIQAIKNESPSAAVSSMIIPAMSLPADLPAMEYVRLGKTGLKVSRICLGCMSYGSPVWSPWVKDEEESIKQIKLAYQAGINFFDTADAYSSGLSEIILGKALKEIGAHRGRVVIATKCFFPVHDSVADVNKLRDYVSDPMLINRVGLSRKHILDAVEGSLKRLGVDYIDLYQIHRLDSGTPMEEIMEALNDLVRSGKVRYIGASSMAAWEFQKMNNIAERRGWAKFVSMQNLYNLLAREEEREMIPYCLDAGIAGIPYSPLASGVIVGKNRTTERSASGLVMTKLYPNTNQDSNDIIVDHVEEIAKKYNATNAQIALAWHFTKPYSTSPIVGVSKVEQLIDLLGALKIKLTEEDVKHLEAPYTARPANSFNF